MQKITINKINEDIYYEKFIDIEEFNNLRAELNEQLMNIENETTILINTLKIIQDNQYILNNFNFTTNLSKSIIKKNE